MEKRLNIFITQDEKKILDNLKYKYRISYSTIAEILATQYWAYLSKWLSGERLLKTGKKTSIKADTEHSWTFNIYENAIHIYCNKLDKEYYKETPLKKNEKTMKWADKMYGITRNNIHNEFAKRKDPYYDYNTFIRYAEAFKKQRKEQI